jgi:TonB family protein
MIELIGEAALRSLAVAGIVRLGIALLRITNPQQEKILWTTLLAGALAMPALVRWGSIHGLQLVSFSAPDVAVYGSGPSDAWGMLRAWGTLQAWEPLVLTLYLSVSLALLARMATGWLRMQRISTAATRIRAPWTVGLDVRVTRELSSPATFGATILLPPSHAFWTDAKRTIILRHEEAHVRHHDSLIQWLASLHACLFWFSPLSWWLRRRLAQLAEYASDDAVLRRDIPKLDYATVLMEEAEMHSDKSMLVSVASHSLEQRVDRILSAKHSGRLPSRPWRALAAASVIPVIGLAAAGVGVIVQPQQALAGASQGAALAQRTPAQVRPAPTNPSRPVSPPQTSSPAHPASTGAPPEILSGPTDAEMREFYPAEAKAKGIDGLVQITVTVDEAGRATDTHIVSETPAGLGFGAAASELAHHFKYKNPATLPGTVTYRIKFELDRPSRTAAPATDAPGT